MRLKTPYSSPPHSSTSSARTGVLYGVAAYALWGVFPLYFKLLDRAGVTPWEILVHRVIWSAALLAGIVTVLRRWPEVLAAVANRRTLATLALSTLLIAANWLSFLYAISTEQVLQASLGYFLTPLMNVLLGVTVLGERLRVLQLVSVALATIGVCILAWFGGEVPWIALVLAVTFAFYGLCRKTVAVDSVIGLAIETFLLTPIAAVCLVALYATGLGRAENAAAWTLLIFSGVATAIPLLLFAGAARRLRFVTIGFLQYLGPTIQFFIAVLVFQEPFGQTRIAAFALIWAAIAVYSVDSLLSYRRPELEKMPLEDL